MTDTPNVQVSFQDLYADSFRCNIATIQEQVDAGLYSLKRYAFYLQKMCTHRKPALIELLKDTEHESGKKDRIELDRMSNYVLAYRHMQDIQYQLLTDELKFVNNVSESVVDPLLAWHKQAEKRRDALIKREEKLTKEMKDMQAKVISARKDCHKQWQTAQSQYRDYAKVDVYLKDPATASKGKYTTKDLVNCEKKIDKEKIKCEAIFKQLEETIRSSNLILDTYWNTDIPAILRDWEALEDERLSLLGSHMLLYSQLQHGQIAPISNAASMLFDDVKSLAGSQEMLEFASSNVRQNGRPIGPVVLQPQLPCSSSELSYMDNYKLHELLATDMQVAIATADDPTTYIPTINVNSDHPIELCRQPSPIPEPVIDLPEITSSGSVSSILPSYSAQVATREHVELFITAPVNTIAIVVGAYDFDGTDSEDLVFRENDLIAVSNRPDDSEWWIGSRFDPFTGAVISSGAFPCNYIEELDVQYKV